MHVLVIAEKGMESTNHHIPTQLQYLEEDNCDWTQTYKNGIYVESRLNA